MAQKKGHSMGDMKGGSLKRTSSGEYEATVRFANGVEGTGTGKSKSAAQHAAVENAKSKGGSGAWLLIGAILLLGAGL
jgi:hypothetical protein